MEKACIGLLFCTIITHTQTFTFALIPDDKADPHPFLQTNNSQPQKDDPQNINETISGFHQAVGP